MQRILAPPRRISSLSSPIANFNAGLRHPDPITSSVDVDSSAPDNNLKTNLKLVDLNRELPPLPPQSPQDSSPDAEIHSVRRLVFNQASPSIHQVSLLGSRHPRKPVAIDDDDGDDQWESYSGRSSTSTSSSDHLVAPRRKSARRDAPPSKAPAVPPKPARRDSKSRRPRKAVKSGLHVEIPRRSSSRKSAVAITYSTNVVVTHGSDRFVNNILAVPFIRSDPTNPSTGVVIVVEQFQVVSEPEPTPVRHAQPKPSDCSGRAPATDLVLPEQPGKIAEPFRDKAPAGSDLVSPQVAEPPERSSEPPLPPLPVENPHVARLRNGAKRRKHYSPQYPTTRSNISPVS
ncbi:hypothetical protein HMN09_00217100 [Mycena chlorophos]|uniref:Uncharacterized protein n=1 Tax=Mycena chlorophos TaxID=658473 RepID=A0A8H6TJE6_MYCCL|nr:hypothetical protein HMN09_00217100 [Mycena chlorophos]